MLTKQTLTLAEVKTKAREFYEAGKLTAQHPIPSERRCVNDGGDGYRCAVAAAFNDDVIREYPKGTIVGAVRRGHIVVLDRRELHKMIEIQDAHDRWASAAQTDPARARQFQSHFLALINN